MPPAVTNMPPAEDVIEKKSMNQDVLLPLAKEDNPKIDYIHQDKLISSVMIGNKMNNEILKSILNSLKSHGSAFEKPDESYKAEATNEDEHQYIPSILSNKAIQPAIAPLKTDHPDLAGEIYNDKQGDMKTRKKKLLKANKGTKSKIICPKTKEKMMTLHESRHI